uniref:ATP synthase F0 subunit 8 n=1 Tax=Leptocimbex linealis TaxID=2609717 RepID=UPI0022386DD7|nr:ATP synthase F0 subunit 8 [Leptocimbex linealis]UYK52108.1 ATP synthase F0 subunit 8 [Leptocimbex linealis]
MPQMFPMNWLNQYIYFMLLFYIIILFNYYFNNFVKFNNKNFTVKNLKKNKLNWKW